MRTRTRWIGLAAAAAFCGAAADVPRAKWLENGLIDAGGSHEPYIFMVRVGGSSTEARQQYERAQSEEVIRRLHDQGIEVFHTHLYKGFGMQAEMPEMEDARKSAAVAHGLGMKVDSYIQWNSMMYETFLAEEPRAVDWVQRDASGKPIMLTYDFEQSFRYRPCFSNPDYLEYLKRIVKYAVQDVKTDFIHFDNFDLNREPESCHCPFCTRGFREYLKAKFTPAQRRERFGFENVDYMNPPLWNQDNPPQKLQIIRDPGIQEWIAYRCHEMSEALRQLSEFARTMNPEVAIEVNPAGITGQNRPWEAGLDHTQFLHWTDAFWTEEGNVPRLEPDGRLVSRIRSYKLARAYHNILLSLVGGNPVALAEDLAFNQTIGYVGEDPLRPDTLRYLDFYRQHRNLYRGSEDDATVAVLRSYPSITYDNAHAQLAAILVEQALIQARVPFRLIFDEHLADLSRYKVLVLPGSVCLSDTQVAAIQEFVAKGGGLVATGDTGLYDDWYRRRSSAPFPSLLPGQRGGRGGRGGGRGRGAQPAEPAPTAQTEYQQGRAAYIPAVAFDGPLPEMQPFFAIENRFWKNPKNAAQVVDAVRWAARNSLPVAVDGPAYLVANLVHQSAERRSLLHLVNYDAANVPAIAGVNVSIPATESRKLSKVTVFSPDARGETVLTPSTDASGIHFQVPEVRTYTVVVLQWQ